VRPDRNLVVASQRRGAAANVLKAIAASPGEKPRAATGSQRAARFSTLLAETKSPVVARTQLERLIGANDLVGIAYLERGFRAAKSICRIHLRDEQGNTAGFGTGFLVAPGVLMTNHHVIATAAQAATATAEFSYELDVAGKQKETVEFALVVDPPLIAHQALDFCLVLVHETSRDGRRHLAEFAWLPLDPTPGKAFVGEYLTIIQHPGGERNRESSDFLGHMQSLGLHLALLPKDTGRGETIHSTGPSTEWFACFYKGTVLLADDLPHGFLAEDRSANPLYDRAPYATAFRTVDGRFDFVLINAHLKAAVNDAAGRHEELQAVAAWIGDHDQQEKDFLVLGDMNIQSAAELDACLPPGFRSLNSACVRTNLSTHAKPFDHVMLRPQFTTEVDDSFGFRVVDLIAAMVPFWSGPDPYPGSPYSGQPFPQFFSDHHPVAFQSLVPASGDDP